MRIRHKIASTTFDDDIDDDIDDDSDDDIDDDTSNSNASNNDIDNGKKTTIVIIHYISSSSSSRGRVLRTAGRGIHRALTGYAPQVTASFRHNRRGRGEGGG